MLLLYFLVKSKQFIVRKKCFGLWQYRIELLSLRPQFSPFLQYPILHSPLTPQFLLQPHQFSSVRLPASPYPTHSCQNNLPRIPLTSWKNLLTPGPFSLPTLQAQSEFHLLLEMYCSDLSPQGPLLLKAPIIRTDIIGHDVQIIHFQSMLWLSCIHANP